MYLKAIEIKGFKSFGRKSVLNFSPKINVIVGPNGAGKSNIVDAIRWALGEQSLKNIRVEKSEDLIFAGNKMEKPAGLAEVNLIFDNSDHKIPLEFSEVSISRRLNRDGLNEYLINRGPCRLKDINELLAQMQLGLKGFSIINQGAIENILRVSPTELRQMLLEILGLRSLEIKKNEAQRKLENSLLNLNKVDALKAEILPHLRSLKRQAQRFKREAEIRENLKAYETAYFSRLWALILKERQGSDDRLKEINHQCDFYIRNIKKLEDRIKETEKNDFSDHSSLVVAKIEELKNQKLELVKKLAKLEGYLESQKAEKEERHLNPELLASRFKEIKKALLEINELNDLGAIRHRLNQLIHLIDETLVVKSEKEDEEINALKKEAQQFEAEISRIEDLIFEQNKVLKDLKEKEQNSRQQFYEIIKELEENRHQLEKWQAEKQSLELSLAKFNLQEEDIKRRLKEEGFNYDEFINSVPEASQNFAELDLSTLESKINRLKRELIEVGGVDDSVLKEYEEVNKRYEFLNNQSQDLRQAIGDLKKLIRELSFKINDQFKRDISEISAEFNQYFRLMFKGGKAQLEILKEKTNEKDLENSPSTDLGDENIASENEMAALGSEVQELKEEKEGIEIKVEAPKAKLKGLEFLSGGEKALVAICLIFAIIFKSSPPLLIMDEIDAALDEANSRKFSEILRELSQKSQFIIITHNRTTMEAADYIYGVTFSETGTSQLLSLKFEEATHYVSVK